MLPPTQCPTLRTLTRDGWLLFLTRFVRLFAYGSLSVVLVFYLIGLGLSESQTRLLLTLTLAGESACGNSRTPPACASGDRAGRRVPLSVPLLRCAMRACLHPSPPAAPSHPLCSPSPPGLATPAPH